MAFTPRLTAPARDDPRFIMQAYGGYNLCIAGALGPPSVLPNCTGYVHGRLMEIRNVNTDNCGLSFGNGADYYNGSSAIWTKSQNPSLGAVVCYYTKNDYQPGHVGIVEQIIDNDTIVVSESDYGDPSAGLAGIYFRTVTCYRQYGWRPSDQWNVTAQGFLTNPYVDDQPVPGEPIEPALLLMLLFKRGKKKNGKRIIRI